MADNTNTLQLTLQIKDDGSIVVDQVAGKIKGLGDETEKAASKSSKSLGGLKENWLALTVGVTAGYFAIKKNIDILNSFVTAAAEAEKIESRMAFQIEATGIQYDKIKYSIDAYASSISKSTRFSDEAAREGLGKMMMYTDNLGEALKNTKLAMDMSIQTGMDLDSVIRLIGMAMGGEVEVLNRWVLQIRNINSVLGENASASEKWGYTQKILMDLFGGAAQKDVQTYSGSLAQMKNEMDEIQKLLGGKLLPYFQMWQAGVRSIVAEIFPEGTEALKQLNHELELNKQWLEYGKEQGASEKFIKSYIDRISEIEKKIVLVTKATKILNADTIKAEQDRAAAAKRGSEEITKYASILDEADHAYKMLGITSTDVLKEQVSKTLWAMEKIKQAWQEGKKSELDYLNALTAAKDALDKLKPADDYEKRLGVEKEYQKKLTEIMKMEASPERRQAASDLTDWWIEEIKKLDAAKPPTILDIPKLEQGIAKTKTDLEKLYGSFDKPIEPKVNKSKAIIEMDGILYKYNEIKDAIERFPIQINTQGGGISSGEGFSGASPIKWASDVEANINFTATGLSPKISLGSAFDKIESRFKTVSEKAQAMESIIQFQSLSNQMRDLQKKNDLITESARSWVETMRHYSVTLVNPNQLEYIKSLNAAQADLFEQMKIYRLQMAEQKYLLGLPGSEEEFYNIFKSKYHVPVYQHGTPYVPGNRLSLG